MERYGPDQRALFEESAAALYEEAVNEGGLSQGDDRLAPGGECRDAFDLLVSLGLLIHDQEAGQHVPVDPSAVQSRVVAPMSQQGAALISESSHWAETFGTLAHAWRRSPAASRGPFTELQGEAIGAFITSVVADAESELLTAQPQTGRSVPGAGRGRRARHGRDQARGEDAHALPALGPPQLQHALLRRGDHRGRGRGAHPRRVLQPADRGRPAGRGDPRTGRIGALAVREPIVVEYLVDVFERHWERARPYINRESTMLREVAAEQRAMTIRMLIEGHADPSSAKRLGVSPRTYAGYVADLKSEYEAETRFQLGYAMGRLGVSGQEGDPGDAAGELG